MSSLSDSDTATSTADTSRPTDSRGENPIQATVYLYGFLATLILIFIVSLAVAYKGYRTRVLIRRRIDEALAAGVYIPGISDGRGLDGFNGVGGRRTGRTRRDIGEKPVLYNVWLASGEKEKIQGGSWSNLQPVAAQPWSAATQTEAPKVPAEPPTLDEWARAHPLRAPGAQSWRPQLSNFQFRLGSRPTQANDTEMTSNPPNPSGNASNTPPSAGVPPHDPRHPPTSPPEPVPAPPEPEKPNDKVKIVVGVTIAMPDRARPNYTLSSHAENDRQLLGFASGSGFGGAANANRSIAEDATELPELVLGYVVPTLQLTKDSTIPSQTIEKSNDS